MPKVRNPRGARARFSPARIMATITRAYSQAFSGKTPMWRADIQTHASRVIEALGKTYGNHEDADWPRAAIASLIEDELRERAPTDVHESYLDQHPERKARKSAPWGKFEGQVGADPHDDPVWSIARGRQGEAPADPQSGDLSDLGESARGGIARKKTVAVVPPRAVLRSDWLEFWRTQASLADKPFDMESFERVVLSVPAEQKLLDAGQWWRWWQEVFARALDEDVRLLWLWRVALGRHEVARIAGQSWLDGSGLPGFENTKRVLDESVQGQALYRRLWVEHMRKWLLDPEADPQLARFDLEAMALKMAPLRDKLVDFSGWLQLAGSDALWGIGVRVWTAIDGMPHDDAREPPQWAWMRLAMTLACQESDPAAMAGQFYETMSLLEVVPSETLLREAGRRGAVLLEDRAALVRDEFSDIQDKIHLAAVATKWTGTVALDWGRVRAQGSPIAGRRISQGVVGFLRAIHMALAAQGREGGDRPVTVSLPLWHRDVEAFLDLRLREADRLQIVVRVPDLFFQRLREGAEWSLLDPGVFEGLDGDFATAYTQAEGEMKAQLRQWPACAKTVNAERLWGRLTRAMSQGSPFLSLEGPAKAAGDFSKARLAGGVDGVGAFPVASDDATQQTRWPSAVVNLARCLDDSGTPDPDRMARAGSLALRMLDNAALFEAPLEGSSTWLFRPVCLGLVGYYEAILQATDTASDDPALVNAWVARLAENWAAIVLRADATLATERGMAPAYLQGLAQPFDPVARHKRLAKARGGSKAVKLKPTLDWGRAPTGHRFGTRTLWAPFLGLARIAGATPGGLGTLRVEELVRDEHGQMLRVPSRFLLTLAQRYPDDAEGFRAAFRTTDPAQWPARVRDLVAPDAAGWEVRLRHAALIAPWLDQGVSLTMRPGMERDALGLLIQKAWWLGLSNIRFDGGDK